MEKQLRRKVLLPLLLFSSMFLFLTAMPAYAAIGGTVIGGCLYTGSGAASYTAGVLDHWTTHYAPSPNTPPITDAQVLVQNQHHGSRHITYGTMGLGANGNCWEAEIDQDGDGAPDATDLIVVFAAPGHAVTSREWFWDPDGRYDPVNHGVLPTGSPPGWTGGNTANKFLHPTGLHPSAGGGVDASGEPVSQWLEGPQDAYLMAYPQKTTSHAHYVFYDHFTDGNDNGPLIDPPINGVTVNVFDEHGVIVASQVTGQLGLRSTDPGCINPNNGSCQGGFITDDGVAFIGAMADGYVYFTGLPGDDEYKIEVDPSTVTSALNPQLTFGLPDSAGPCTEGAPPQNHYNYELPTCKWYQTYTEEGTHAGEIYAWPGSPGTMAGGYLTWHGLVEKLPSNMQEGNPNPSPLLGTISGTLLDSTGSDPLEAPTTGHGGRVPPTNARFENGISWNRTRSASNWGGTADPLAPASDVIPNSRIMDGRVVLYSLNGPTPKVVATAVATNPVDYNDPVNGGQFEFTNVPPGNYALYAMDRNLYYVMFTGANVMLPVAGNVAVPMLYERWGARTMGFIERTASDGTTSPAVGLTVKKWYKAGTTKYETTSNANGWFFDPMWWETGQMGVQYIDPVDGADWRGKIVTEQFQDLPTIIEPTNIFYNWVTHNSISRSVGYATHNYFVDLQIEDIPATVGNLTGAVFNDHFSYKLDPARHNRSDGVYGDDEDRLLQGKPVELYSAPTGAGETCATLATASPVLQCYAGTVGNACSVNADCDTAPGASDGVCSLQAPGLTAVGKTGKFSKSDASIMGWNRPYTYPMDEIGSMHASPVMFFPPLGSTVPAGTPGNNLPAIPPADYVAGPFPNIGTSASEAARFLASPNYGPMPGFYEFRDLAPGNYCVRTIPGAGKRRSPDEDVEPGGYRSVVVTAGLNSRVDLGTNTTPTTSGTCNAGGTCSNNARFSCAVDADCVNIGHAFGIRQSGEVEGGVWDGMQAVDSNPTSLLFMDAIALMGSPVEIKDGNDYFIGVGYQGDTRCHWYNNLLHTPGASMLDPADPLYDPFSCRSTVALSSKPELERRFAPGANRYRGNAHGFPWNRQDPSVPAYWGGQPLPAARGISHIHNPAYTTMELGIGVSQAGYKFEAAWTPIVQTGGPGNVWPICATGITPASFVSVPWGATVVIHVVDGWSPVGGAEVFGTWSTGQGDSCITNATGDCAITLANVNPGDTSVTFSLNNIVPAQGTTWYTYDSNPTSPPWDATNPLLGGVCRTTTVAFDPVPPPVPECSDGLDNDGNGIIDFAGGDPGCDSATDTTEFTVPPAQCSDGLDNDGDGLIDFPADPGCTDAADNDEFNAPPPPPPPVYVCSDGLDNDGDGLIDFPADPGCADAFDPDETDPPVGGPVSVHITSFSATYKMGEKLRANVTVNVEDNQLAAAAGITVDISYTFDKEGTPKTRKISCVTDGAGTCTTKTKGMEKVSFFTMSVTGATDQLLLYAPADNTVPTTNIMIGPGFGGTPQ